MWPALAIIAASAFLKAKSNRDALARQEQFRRSMEGYQRSKSSEVEAATNALAAQQSPQARAAEVDKINADRTQSLKDTVGAAQASAAPKIAGVDNAAYSSTEQANAERIAERTRRAIEQLSTMGAPSEVQRKFGLRFGKAAGDVDAANNASANVGRGYLSDMNTVRPNAMLSTLGDVGMAAGSGMLLGGAGGGAAAGATAQPNLASPNNADWGSLDDGPGAYRVRPRVSRAFSLWGSS